MHPVLCPRDLYVLRAQRIIGFLLLITHKITRSETLITWYLLQLNFVHSNKGAGQRCCYNQHGNLMVGAPDGGSLDRVHPKVGLPVLSHFFHDKVPYHDCCQQSRNCDKYYEKRPSDDSSNYVPPRPGN